MVDKKARLLKAVPAAFSVLLLILGLLMIAASFDAFGTGMAVGSRYEIKNETVYGHGFIEERTTVADQYIYSKKEYIDKYGHHFKRTKESPAFESVSYWDPQEKTWGVEQVIRDEVYIGTWYKLPLPRASLRLWSYPMMVIALGILLRPWKWLKRYSSTRQPPASQHGRPRLSYRWGVPITVGAIAGLVAAVGSSNFLWVTYGSKGGSIACLLVGLFAAMAGVCLVRLVIRFVVD